MPPLHRRIQTDASSWVSAMLVTVAAWGGELDMAHAQTDAAQALAPLDPVWLRVNPGELPKEESATLVALIGADLADLGSELRVEYSTDSESAWFGAADHEPALLLASLDLDDTRWRVTLVDPARRRAVARMLPGARRNAASFEAVAAIILSAASSVAEGSEVGSAPIEEVVQEEPDPEPEQVVEQPAWAEHDPADPLPASAGVRQTWLHLDLGWTTSTLAPERLATFGPELGVGFRRPALFLEARLRQELESRVSTEFGELPIRRTRGFLAGGPVIELGDCDILPWVAAGVEVFQRGQGEPRRGAIAAPARATTHFGLAVGIAAELRILGPFHVRAAAEAALFPQQIEVTATSANQVLLVPWTVSGTGFLGLGLQL